MVAPKEYGIAEKRIHVDKQSGKDFERPNYKRLIRKIKNGDPLVIKSIDRLGRNYDEILEKWRIITKEKQTGVQCRYAMPGNKTESGSYRNSDS